MVTNNADLIAIINDISQITHRKSIKLVEKRIKSCRKNKKRKEARKWGLYIIVIFAQQMRLETRDVNAAR